MLLFHKLPPSASLAAASIATSGSAAAAAADAGVVKGKAMSSGLYARCKVPSSMHIEDVGRDLALTFDLSSALLADCKRTCDMMATCFQFTVNGQVCSLRFGSDAADMRTLFKNPAAATIANLHWLSK
jgi:hypothetical protein